MVRLRNALLIVGLAAVGFGCSHFHGGSGHDYAHWSIFHCTECDDFPAPAYGPGGSMMPGSYSGPESSSAASTRPATPTSSNIQPSNSEAVTTPSEEVPGTPSSEPPTSPPGGAAAAVGLPADGAGAAAPTPPSPPAANP